MKTNTGSFYKGKEFIRELLGYIRYHIFEVDAGVLTIKYKIWALRRLIRIAIVGRKKSSLFLFNQETIVTNTYGRFFIPENSDMVFSVSTGSETDIQKYFNLPTGKIFIDIGANAGKYTVLLGKEHITTYSFEPSPYVFEILKKNIALNEISDKVNLVNMALSDSEGKLKFAASKTFTGVGHVVDTATNQYSDFDYDTIEVSVTTLDSFILKSGLDPKNIFLIKIDVEGHEFSVVTGGRNVLNNMPSEARVIMEIHPNPSQVSKILKLMESLLYSPRQLSTENWLFTKK